jgi:hypothetical protein
MISLLGVAVLFTGCHENIFLPDITPPAIPQGLRTETGDDFVELFWVKNTESDLAGYKIYVSSAYNGKYEFIGMSETPYFLDRGGVNGKTYYYAVTSFDVNGNESELSTDVAYDTPRPEGYDVFLRNYRSVPGYAGYDFSTYSVGQYNDQYTDVFFEYYNGVYYLNVWTDSDIQDVGYTESLYDVGYAPVAGWSPTKDVTIIPGHTYVIWTWDNHFAKLRVSNVSATGITFDWAYQLQEGNPRLKPVTERQSLTSGSGVEGRK